MAYILNLANSIFVRQSVTSSFKNIGGDPLPNQVKFDWSLLPASPFCHNICAVVLLLRQLFLENGRPDFIVFTHIENVELQKEIAIGLPRIPAVPT